MSARMEERMHEAQAEVAQEKEDKRDISTGVYSLTKILPESILFGYENGCRLFLMTQL